MESAMDSLVPALILAAAATFAWFFRGSWGPFGPWGRRKGGPLSLAFTFTLVALVWLVAGYYGYRLHRRSSFFVGTQWADGVIWSQIWAGLVAAVAAGCFWRRGLREIRAVPLPEAMRSRTPASAAAREPAASMPTVTVHARPRPGVRSLPPSNTPRSPRGPDHPRS